MAKQTNKKHAVKSDSVDRYNWQDELQIFLAQPEIGVKLDQTPVL